MNFLRFQIFLIVLVLLFSSCSDSSSSRSIAIVLPIAHPSLEATRQGFIDYLEERYPGRYRFVTYNGNGSQSQLSAKLASVAQGNHALVLTVGALATQMAKEQFAKSNPHLPIVFTAVNNPKGLGIIDDVAQPKVKITGVEEVLDLKGEIEALLLLRPNLKRLLLIYNPLHAGLHQHRQQLAEILKQYQIDLLTVKIFHSNEIKNRVASFIDQVDALLVLRDNTVIPALEVLVKACHRQKVPLVTSDLNSPSRGAALGYGVSEVDFGKEAAQLVALILEEGKDPSTIPVKSIQSFHLVINEEAALVQGIEASKLRQSGGK